MNMTGTLILTPSELAKLQPALEYARILASFGPYKVMGHNTLNEPREETRVRIYLEDPESEPTWCSAAYGPDDALLALFLPETNRTNRFGRSFEAIGAGYDSVNSVVTPFLDAFNALLEQLGVREPSPNAIRSTSIADVDPTEAMVQRVLSGEFDNQRIEVRFGT